MTTTSTAPQQPAPQPVLTLDVTLIDNSVQQLPVDLVKHAPKLKILEVNHMHVPVEMFQKLKTFAVHFLQLNLRDKRFFENPDEIWEREGDFPLRTWLEKFLEIDTDFLLELGDLADKLEFKPLLNLVCYRTACLCRNKNIKEIKRTFTITSEFSKEDAEWMMRENKWE
jgi:hypothetical protein